ncbi:hypothetical protein K402DRAFT_40441 [Aulographum hederae CBS 113979]|uniref:Uncharacterized protein n=1 Tax=Aulographum hederae CBS 113979 TaxID=1176131 RepID=A0A6G1H543_9PEZI|nr:hypothetical protein K402DRAFT_40441 [Aulographum hederae CBS 113979]
MKYDEASNLVELEDTTLNMVLPPLAVGYFVALARAILWAVKVIFVVLEVSGDPSTVTRDVSRAVSVSVFYKCHRRKLPWIVPGDQSIRRQLDRAYRSRSPTSHGVRTRCSDACRGLIDHCQSVLAFFRTKHLLATSSRIQLWDSGCTASVERSR